MKSSFVYRFFQLWVKFSLHIFYKKIEITGQKKLPKKEPVLLVLNHQNAFMDAIAPVTLIGLYTHFLVRADVFKKKIARWFFKQVNMMPIYRGRDGYENMYKNEAIFDKCYDILTKNESILMFPEGNHANQKRLRPLRKGIARIAFVSAEKSNFTLPLKIVPIGLDYSNYNDFRSYLLLNIGNPIEVSNYYEDYRKNSSKTITLLKDKVEEEMETTVLSFIDEKNYEQWKYVADHFFHEKSLSDNWKKQKEWNKKINILAKQKPEEADKLARKVVEYRQKTEKLGIKDFLFEEKINLASIVLKTLLLFILLPVHLLGVVNNVLSFQLTHLLIGKIKDSHFHSSFKLLAGMLLFPPCYLLQIGLVFISADLAWLEWGYAITLLPSGWFSLKYIPRYKKLFGKWRFWQLQRKQNPDWIKAQELRKSIFDTP